MFLFFDDKDITVKCPSPLYQSEDRLSPGTLDPIVMYQDKWYIDRRIKPFASKEETMSYILECLSIAVKKLEEKVVTKEQMKKTWIHGEEIKKAKDMK